MDVKKQPKPWYIRYRYPILSGAAGIAILVYALFLIVTSGTRRVDPDSVVIAEVKKAPFWEYVDVEGLVYPFKTIQVNAMENGFVERVVAEEGAMLQQGDTILVLQNPELYHSIDDEQDAWSSKLRNCQEQEIEMTQKTINLRQQALDAQHQMASLKKSLKQSREMIAANRMEANKKLLRMKGRTQQLVVRAPVSGQLSYLGVTQGQQVSSGASIGQIKVMSQFKLQVSLAEYYIDRVIAGLPAHVEYDGHQFSLRVSRVIPEVKDHQFVCELTFSGKTPANIRLGKSYRVLLELGKPEQALVIPNGDFFQTTNGYWIFRVSDDGKKAQRVNINVGRQNPQQFEITSGLKPGDKVIVSGYTKIASEKEIDLR